MKQKWSRKWKASRQPRKQRKYRQNAPLHTRHKFMSAHLSPALRKQFGRRSVPVRKGDEVKVMKGSSAGMTGTVDRSDLSKIKVYVGGITVKKVDGSEVMKALEPSNLMITKLDLEDKMRKKVFDRSPERERKPAENLKNKKVVEEGVAKEKSKRGDTDKK